MPRRFVITNTVALNGGDAAILMAIVKLLRERFGADTQIDVFDAQAGVAQRYFAGLSFQHHLSLTGWGGKPRGRVGRYVHHARLLAAAGGPLSSLAERLLPPEARDRLLLWRRADAIISTGGTYLTEHYALGARWLDFDVARRLGQKLILYTQSVGAFRGDPRGARLGRVFRQARLALLRDERSLEHVCAMAGAHCAHWHVQPDVAFSLADSPTLSAAMERRWPGRDPHVLISVRRWDKFAGRSREEGQRAYRESVARLTQQLVEQWGARVTFVSTCQGIKDYWTDDSVEAQHIVGQLDASTRQRVDVDGSYHSPEALMHIAAAADLVIATRLHMAILALSAGTPVLPISYEHKTAEVFAQLGQAEHVLNIDTISPTRAESTLNRFMSSLPTERRPLFEAVARLRAGAIESILLLERAIA